MGSPKFYLLSNHIYISSSWQFFLSQMKSTRTSSDPWPHTQTEVFDWKNPRVVPLAWHPRAGHLDTKKLGEHERALGLKDALAT